MAKLPKKQVDNSSVDDIIKSKAINRIDLHEGRLIQSVYLVSDKEEFIKALEKEDITISFK